MIALLAALAVAANAEPLKPLRVVSAERVGVLTAQYAVVPGKTGLGVWDLARNREIALVDMPDLVVGDEDRSGLYALAVSPDGKWILADVEKSRENGTDEPEAKKGSAELLLISVAEQRVARRLAQVPTETCQMLTFGSLCASYENASFSPDGSKVLYWVLTGNSAKKTSSSKQDPDYHTWSNLIRRKKETIVLADLTGRVLAKQAFDGVRDEREPSSPWVNTPEKHDAGFLADGRAAELIVDDAGCQVKTFDGARVSLLDDCAADRKPQFSSGLVLATKGAYSVWDPVSGALKYKLPLAADDPTTTASDDLSTVVQTATATPPTTASVKIFDAASGEVLARREVETPSEEIASYQGDFSRADGRLLLWGQSAKAYRSYLGVYRLSAAPAPVATAPAPAPRTDVDTPPLTKTKPDPNAYAVVIGVEKYRQEGIPAVDYAAHDARTVYAYLTLSMGFDPKNVVLLTDDKATKTDLEKNLRSWLANRVDEQSRVFIYYAGHGAPNPATGEGYLMPYEADPNYLSDTAFPLSELYAAVGKLPTKNVSIVLDACFSGQGGRSLIAKGARPLVLAQKQKTPDNALVLAAAQASQISASDPERQHGLLTSYLLEGLHGAADAHGDGKITAAELFAYVKPAVERAARLQNIEQMPSLSGAPDPQPWIVLQK